MKILLLAGFLFIFTASKAQEQLKVPEVSHMFIYNAGAKGSTEKINDTLLVGATKERSNYRITLMRNDSTQICSCLYRLSGKTEQFETMKHETVGKERKMTKGTSAVKWLEPVADNCIKQYRAAFN